MKIRNHLAILFFVTAFFTACNKEDKPENSTSANCKLSKAFLYGETDSTTFVDTVVYTYTNDKITKLTVPDGYATFDYSNGRVSRRNYFDGLDATTSTDYEAVTYNNDGTVAKIESYSESGADLDYRDEFAYSAGKLVKFTETWYTNGAATEVETDFYTYTGGNITQDSVVVQDFPYQAEHFVYRYSYDAAANHLQKGGTDVLMHSPVFFDFDGGMLPYFFSANNVTGVREQDNNEEIKFGYTTDANGNLNIIKVNGMPAIMWQYQCP